MKADLEEAPYLREKSIGSMSESTPFPGKYLSITSFRRDGTAVATPVWFVQEGRRLLVETEATSGKVKRIRRNSSVLVAPCTATGRPRTELVDARAELLGPEELQRVRALMARKYRFDRVFILPIYRAVQALRRKARPGGEPVIVAITPV
jgi:PPOX class probable F420-dependent enzyme